MPNQYTALLMPDRFLVNVDKDGPPADRHPEFGNCWLWMAYLFPDGYGAFYLDRRSMRAHQTAWMVASGLPIPPGMKVCHTCDIRQCVRHDDIGTYEVDGILYERRGHLWLGNTAANLRDMVIKGRSLSGDRNARYMHPETTARGERSGRYTKPEATARGSRHGNAKLTEATVLVIRARYAQGGITLQALGDEVGVGKDVISGIVRHKTWTHI